VPPLKPHVICVNAPLIVRPPLQPKLTDIVPGLGPWKFVPVMVNTPVAATGQNCRLVLPTHEVCDMAVIVGVDAKLIVKPVATPPFVVTCIGPIVEP